MDDAVAELNVEEASASIGQDLFGVEPPSPEPETVEATPEAVAEPATVEAAPEVPAVQPPPVRPAPKSWAKEQHEVWSKLDPLAQDYVEKRERQMLDGLGQYKADADFAKSLRDAFQPYRGQLQATGLNEQQAVQNLLSINQRLTQGSIEQRTAAYRELGRNLGIGHTETGEQPAIDPELIAVKQEINQLRQSLTQREQAAFEETKSKIAKDVEAFAADPKHAYFEAVAEDMMPLLQAGASLQDAYDKAIWANGVTRAQELVRLQTEAEAKAKENARLAALPKDKAKSVNVKSKDTGKAPTEPLGTWDDTMKAALADIKSR